ncbi:MAG TPA: DUF2281 domain-containing protein [Dongiaceae bacterium]|nr:DUF2281 domain-containing protein [Dongiaceae bacterium]
MNTVAKKQLLEISEKLPAEQVREVVDFAEFLAAKSAAGVRTGAGKGAKALRRYIGGVGHGALSRGIDDALYGRPVR